MSNVPFRIMRGEESLILTKPFNDGQVYFATDTKKIYMDTYLNGIRQEKIVLGGGNSGIYYAKKTFLTSSDVTFTINDIEGKQLPAINDLIINYGSDNDLRDGFYRVEKVDLEKQTVDTIYLPVGGGTGGPGQGGGSKQGQIKITPSADTPYQDKTTKQKGYTLKYSVEIYDNNNNPIPTPAKASYIVNGNIIEGPSVVHGGSYELTIDEYLTTTAINEITLKITGSTGGVIETTQHAIWYITCIDLRVDWKYNYNSNNYISEDNFSINMSIYGGEDCVAHVSIDDGEEINVNYFTRPVSSAEKEITITLSSLDYGAHKITVFLTKQLGDTLITSNIINNTLTFISGNQTEPILTVPFYEEIVTQYDTLKIPFLIYKPNVETVPLSFYVDDILVMTEEYKTSQPSGPYYWPYTVGKDGGEVTLKIEASKTEFWEHKVQIIPLSLGITDPVDGLAFSLRAKEFSGNVELREWNDKGVNLTFSPNFDWENGGIKFETDESGNINKYIRIPQGCWMDINYNLFGTKQVSAQGKTFKFCFKAMNCFDYNAQVLECMEYRDASKTEPLLGVKYTAQSALFASAANANFNTQYCEGNYIELETEIWPDMADIDENFKGDRFLMFWVDGVPTGAKTFTTGTRFYQTNPQNIRIGSNECDVYIYTAKVYEKKLSIYEHLNSFIFDAPNVNEIKNRHYRNDILGENNEISYRKLVTNNPGCHAYLYKLTEQGMTPAKDYTRPCDYEEYYLNGDKPYLTTNPNKLTNNDRPMATVEVQGTSSAAYGVAAFNIRTDFGDAPLYDKDKNQLKGRKVSETSIPVDYTCTKVNVASCENANNALNQEWYNRFQPYHDAHRRKSTLNAQYRDCMEFDFGVVFIEDHNPNTEYFDSKGKPDSTLYPLTNVFARNLEGEKDNKYLEAPYYKQYAVGNMGNDKKNRNVFHDQKNPYVCCVEILDNQNVAYWMTREATLEDFKMTDEDTGYYEFRYSIEKTKAEDKKGITKESQAQAFIDFVNWMASCDPNPYDPITHPSGYKEGEQLKDKEGNPITVTYSGPKVFEGFNPPGYENDDSNPSGIAGIKGTVISGYEGTYTTDSRKYRLAKLLYECEEHLVMDSVIYHYLFIQRHTMVDNGAKNTFWSTEDLKHWDLTKNYDNDTSDGNDNSGYLTYEYGVEIMDKKTNGELIFNGSPSVWMNFIYSFPQLQQVLYQQLSQKGAWDAQTYLKMFKEKQSLIPERCWVEDYFRKYIRPRRLGLDGEGAYLDRLEGGKKTHQRQQYETYQEIYMDSKYCYGKAFQPTGSLDMRLNKGPAEYILTEDTSPIVNKKYFEYKELYDENAQMTYEDYILVTENNMAENPKAAGYYEYKEGKEGWTGRETIPIKYYIKLYPSALIGGNLWKGTRMKNNEEIISIPVGTLIDSPTDGTCYIYAAGMIQSLQNIYQVYPNYIKVSTTPKLRNIEVGSDQEGYFNHNLRSLGLGDNSQLETAQLQQVGHKNIGSFDLSKLSMLRSLKMNMGTTVPGLTLAKGSIIDTLYLNPLTELKLNKLYNLDEDAVDENGIKKFQYDNYEGYKLFDSLTDVSIQDCPGLNKFSYNLAKNNKIKNYCFNDIHWDVPVEHWVNKSVWEPNVEDSIEQQEEKLKKSVSVLHNLLDNSKGFVGVDKRSLALTGDITINIPDDEQAEEFLIYKAYKKDFPNLNILYNGNKKEAITITFYNDYNEQTKQFGDKLYEVKSNGSYTLNQLISADSSPLGISIGTPSKKSDNDFHYNWNNEWYIIDENGNKSQSFSDESMREKQPEQNLNIVADYNLIPREYTITLRDHNDNIIPHNISNQTYGADITDLMPIYQYRPHNDDKMRYEFQGWINARDHISGTKNPEIIEDFIVYGNETYYAYYEEQNCITDFSKLDYFVFTDNGKTINLKNEYRYLIQEPLTLPLYSDKDKTIGVTAVGDFGAHNYKQGNEKIKIPAIYFENNGVNGYYNEIKDYAFWSADQGQEGSARMLLKTISLPNTLKKIGGYAFIGCTNLEDIELPDTSQDGNGLLEIGTYAFNSTGKVQIDGTGLSKLTSIGTSAFYRAGDGVVLNSIPENLHSISGWAFGHCGNVSVGNFEHVNTIGADAFNGCGKYKTINIVLPTSLIGYSKGCFTNYATGNLGKVTYNGNGDIDEIIKYLWGKESVFDPTTIEQVIE